MSGSGGRCNGMGAKDVFPAEMPDDPTSTIDPLDDDTAERLLADRLDPLDAPPPYAAVARLLQAAAAPPTPDELAGEPSALAAFRSRQPRPVGRVRARPALGNRIRGSGAPGGGGPGRCWWAGRRRAGFRRGGRRPCRRRLTG
jgi:hypothetical protein